VDAADASGAAPGSDVVPDELLEASDTLEQPAVHADPELDETTQVRLTPAGATPSEAAVPTAAPPARPRKRPLGRRGATALGAAGGAAAAGAAAAGAASASGGATASGASAAAVSEADESTRVLPRADVAPDWLRETPDTTTTTAAATTVTTRSTDGEWLDAPDERYQPDEGGATERPGAGTATAAAGAGAAVAGAFGSVGGRVGSSARRAVDKVSELSPDTAPREDRGDLEAPAPLVPAEPLTKDESKLALAIVVAFVVLALVVGIVGVRQIGSGSDSVLGGDAAPATRTTTVAPSSAAPSSGEATSTGGTGPAEPLAILKVEAYDPEGDGQENNSLTPKTYDGDKSTGWFSENYRSDSFGGLKKGVGVIVDLGPNKKPQAVELNVPHPSDIEVYVGPDNRLEGATKIGEKADADGTVTFDVPADVSGQYIVVWFTKLNADDNGKRRAWLDEVVVTG